MIADSAATALNLLIVEDRDYKTTSKGLARSLVWRNGIPPPQLGANFGTNLTAYLLLQADRSLIAALYLIESNDRERVALGRTGFRRAAEAYESLLRNGDVNDSRRSLNRVLGAASYHLAGYAASAFSLLKMAAGPEPIDLMVKATSLLLARNFAALDEVVRAAAVDYYWGEQPRTEAGRAQDPESAASEQNFAHALALFGSAMHLNRQDLMDECLRRLIVGQRFALETGDVWSHLLYAVCCPLIRGLWMHSITNAIPGHPPTGTVDPEVWVEKRKMFGRVLSSRGIAELELWPSQEEAAARVYSGDESFAAALPTSAGKTRIAELAVFKALLAGKRAVYITPLRALSAQVERGFRRLFGPLGFSVSALYGAQGVTTVDQATFDDNDIVVATPEKAGFALRNAPELFDRVGLVVFDEAHLVSSENRGVAYEALIVALKRRTDHAGRRMIALSALLPDLEPSTAAFARWISDGAFPTALSSPLVQGQPWRPTRQCFGTVKRAGGPQEPLRFRYEINVLGSDSFLNDFVVQQVRPPVGRQRRPRKFPADRNDLALAVAEKMLANQKSVLIYCPLVGSVDTVCSRYLAAVDAGYMAAFEVNPEGREEIERAVRIAEESLPHGSEIVRALRAGLAVHHGQLPRAYLREIDGLIAHSIVRVVVASPTVNAGLNISATCVLFNGFGREMERFQRYNGEYSWRLRVLDGSESMNVAGRAGRAFVDTHGEVLGLCFDADQERHWARLQEKMDERSFTSGLVEVLNRLIVLLEGNSTSAGAVRALIANGVDAMWVQPPITEESFVKWNRAVQMVDQALLAFVDDLAVDAAEIAGRLDEALNSSFFRAAIYNLEKEATFLLLVHSRAKLVWQHSTAEQRKGWYFAGVGLADGLLLDARAEVISPLIAEVEELLENGETEGVIETLTAIGAELFTIPTFAPKDGLPVGWQRIMKQWLEGVSLQFIFADSARAVPDDAAYRAAGHFIEDGLVYRLVWGMEAVRVRHPHLVEGEQPAGARGLRSATYLEAGTLNPTVAVLLQIGLSSRRVAQEVVAQEGLEVHTVSGVRAWLHEQRGEPEIRWSYLDEAIRPLWVSFLTDASAMEADAWISETRYLRLAEHYRGAKDGRIDGLLRRVDIENRTAEFQMADGTPIGSVDWPFGPRGPTIAEATLHADGTIAATYLGPQR